MAWLAPILERGTGVHPLLSIHLESHTARFRSCTMAMIYLASASASMAQFEASPSLQVLFEQVDRCILYRLNLPLLCGSPHIAVCVKM
jgi:hypothetical protein